MTKLDKEIEVQLYDPRGKMKMKYKDFVKAHTHWRVSSGALDLKRIGAAWKAYKKSKGEMQRSVKERALAIDPAPRGQRQSIVSEEQRRAMFAEIDRREAQKKWRKVMKKGTKGGAKYRHFDPASKKKHGISRPPKRGRWFYAMVDGIKKRSDVKDAEAVVRRIWQKLPHAMRAEIKRREAKGERFHYDLPLPEDYATKGTGTVRTVKPFKLTEVQVNVAQAAYDQLRRSSLFEPMRRQDGTVALVKRCKSARGNCNIFVDRAR